MDQNCRKKASETSDVYSPTSSESGENSLEEDFQHKIEKEVTGKEIRTGVHMLGEFEAGGVHKSTYRCVVAAEDMEEDREI
jgi:hypothetical protein